MAASPCRYSHSSNATSAPADPQKSPRILALVHLYVVPPHSRARRHMIVVAANIAKPGKSKERRMADAPVLISLLGRRSGMLMKRRMIMTSAPNGRLI